MLKEDTKQIGVVTDDLRGLHDLDREDLVELGWDRHLQSRDHLPESPGVIERCPLRLDHGWIAPESHECFVVLGRQVTYALLNVDGSGGASVGCIQRQPEG